MLEEEAEGEESGGKVGQVEKQRKEENLEEKDMEEKKEDKEGRGEKVRQVEDRSKRSPACLMRCLKTRRLHPAQCHALC